MSGWRYKPVNSRNFWTLFEETGDVCFYLLFKELDKEEEGM